MRKHIDDTFSSLIYGTTSIEPSPPPEPLTLDKLQRIIAAMPPKETMLSSRLFPEDSAFRVSGSGENFTCAGPGFWLRLEDALRRHAEVKPATELGFCGINMSPTEIDPWPEDSPATANWRAAHWTRLRDAVEVAMIPLPDWLRAPPTFGKHG